MEAPSFGSLALPSIRNGASIENILARIHIVSWITAHGSMSKTWLHRYLHCTAYLETRPDGLETWRWTSRHCRRRWLEEQCYTRVVDRTMRQLSYTCPRWRSPSLQPHSRPFAPRDRCGRSTDVQSLARRSLSHRLAPLANLLMSSSFGSFPPVYRQAMSWSCGTLKLSRSY